MPIKPSCVAPAALLLIMAINTSAADEAETLVYFEHTSVKPLNAAIEAALSRPPFKIVKSISPGVLVIVPDGVASNKQKDERIFWQFTTKFSRDGDSLGESYQSCLTSNVLDCTEQIRLDAMTASKMQANR